jgi:signal transduction histidine kinase
MADRPGMDQLDRRSWWLWTAAFALIAGLTLTIPVVYVAFLQLLGGDQAAPLTGSYDLLVGLVGLVVLFILYTIVKQREIHGMRERMRSEVVELEDVRTRLSEVSALFTLATTLNLQLKLEVILEIIVRRVVSTLRAQQASVMLYDPATGLLETRASYGLESEFARNARQRLGEGIAGKVAERMEAMLLGPRPQHDEIGRHYKRNRNITSALSLPLRVGNRCVGVLNVNRINHPDLFQEHHRETLRLFAEHVGAVIERAEAMERLTRHTRDLERTNEHLAELNRVKDVFLSTATHELKTPLTAVIAYAELLEHHEARLTKERQAEFLRRLRGEARNLLGLIEDILDVSRIETGKLRLERVPVSVETLVHEAIATTQPSAEKFNVRLVESHSEPLPQLELDEIKMRQVVVNLLVNAAKFSPAGSDVKVVTRRDGDEVVIEVVDQGPGVAPEDAVHIFSLFGQGVRQRSSGSSGLGIGLHLVRRLTELHGGHVGVNSSSEHGSTFWVRLPLATTEAQPLQHDGLRQAPPAAA